jgi:hypothetical protein
MSDEFAWLVLVFAVSYGVGWLTLHLPNLMTGF